MVFTASAAHYNPAVTLAVAIRGKCAPVEAALYWLAQIAGAFAGGGVGLVVLPQGQTGGYPVLGAGVTTGQAFVAEAVLTLSLAHTILHVATASKQTGNSYYGLAIGWTVLSGAISVGGVSGGCFNPAVAMLTVANGAASSELWLHVVAPLAGGLFAGVLFRFTHPQEVQGPEAPAATMMSTRQALAPFVVEFVGTCMLAFTVGCAAAPSNGSGLAPLAIGAMLMTQVFMGGATSGGHYNPAVSLGALVRAAEGFTPRTALGYLAAQLAGGVAGGGLARAAVPAIGFPAVASQTTVGAAFVAELVATSFLVFVVLQAATNSKTQGNSFFGLAIGFTVCAMAVSVGGLSGGAFNPAVAMLALVSGSPLASSFWVYLVAPPLGGVVAGIAFRVVSFDEFAIESEAADVQTMTV